MIRFQRIFWTLCVLFLVYGDQESAAYTEKEKKEDDDESDPKKETPPPVEEKKEETEDVSKEGDDDEDESQYEDIWPQDDGGYLMFNLPHSNSVFVGSTSSPRGTELAKAKGAFLEPPKPKPK